MNALWLSVRRTTYCSCKRSLSTLQPFPLEQCTVVKRETMHLFVERCMIAVNTQQSHAAQLAHVLLEGDYRGHYSHGLNRLGMYVNDVATGVCVGQGQPEITRQHPATAHVNGNNLLGAVVGNYCMDLAISKAQQTGIGWVTCNNSNHYGIAGSYPMRAMRQGMIGVSMTNTSPISFPTRSAQAALGTNPLAVAAAGLNGDAFVLDMATTAVAVGKIEIVQRTGSGDLPPSWAVDDKGRETLSAQVCLSKGGLLPLGGHEITGGYKGYGLSAMVEMFCGLLGGATWGPHVRKWMQTSRPADLGQCFVAIDPNVFVDDFHERVQEMLDTLRSLPATDPSKGVIVAGDAEREHMSLCDRLGGVPYHSTQIQYLESVAEKYNVRTTW